MKGGKTFKQLIRQEQSKKFWASVANTATEIFATSYMSGGFFGNMASYATKASVKAVTNMVVESPADIKISQYKECSKIYDKQNVRFAVSSVEDGGWTYCSVVDEAGIDIYNNKFMPCKIATFHFYKICKA
ncbi:MAG: hypothetical protein SFT91_05145 [Rickettsiaceae bacterium]|nr:hypothetical protein [Rickettsiaceae bacterium]